MFAPPSLVATLVTLSPKLNSLPAGIRAAIAEAGDVPGPGRYKVVGAPSGLNVRESGSTTAKILATVPNGTSGTSDGTVDNGFAFMQYDTGPNGWSSVAFLAPEAQAPISAGGGAPSSPDLTPGTYQVMTEKDPLNLRSQPSTSATILATIPRFAKVKVTGVNQNYFSQVDYQGKLGWAASAFLVPAQATITTDGGLALSSADLLQLRSILAAWATAKNWSPPYGAVEDFELTQAAMVTQGKTLAGFQQWSNTNQGTALRTDGIVDQATRDALIAWGAAAVANTDPAGSPAGPQLPATPTAVPTPGSPSSPEPASPEAPAGEQAKSGALFALLAIGVAAFFLVEEKKRKRAA